jgi:hypothetical protein
MKSTSRTLLSFSLMISACGGAPEEVGQTSSPISFEEFEKRATREFEGRKIYVLEGDLPVSHEELVGYYQQHVLGRAGLYGTESSGLAVNRVGGVDDIWNTTQRFNLTYCVSDEFAVLKSRVVSEMAAATGAWEGVADVDFTYVPGQDASCTGANMSVAFAVRPWSSGGACAFFPSGNGCVPRTVVIDYNDFDNNPIWDTLSPNITTGGVLIHELGHVLGFRHEHTRDPFGCFEDDNWRGLTVYDPQSTMHYPWCPGGISTSTLQLTPIDKEGASSIYGWYTHLNDADRRTPIAPNGDYWQIYDVGQSFTAPFTVTIRHIDGCFFTGYGPVSATIRAGDNIHGAVLAASTSISTAGACNWGETWVRATFPDTALSGGSSYTVRFSNNNNVMGVISSPSGVYSGGAVWDLYNGGRRLDVWDFDIRIVRPAP